MNDEFSDAYLDCLERGPFPGVVDTWAERARFFQQLNSGLIQQLQIQLKRPLMRLGYIIGKETSLQIAENLKPDLAVERNLPRPKAVEPWSYTSAAAEILAEPGIVVDEDETDLQALFISDFESGQLITVLEIISPRNKTHPNDVVDFQAWRGRMVKQQGINFVEIDLTRSLKRMLENTVTADHAYHIAIYMPDERPRIFPVDFGQPLKRIALPLRGEVVPMELQPVYDAAYRDGVIAGHVLKTTNYDLDRLPFQTLLTEDQQQEALDAVAKWKSELATLNS